MSITRARWTLRRRLVFGIVALLAAVSFIVGTVSVLALNDSLVGKLDDQVVSATSRFQNIADRPGPGDGSGGRPPGDTAPLAGLPPGTVVHRDLSAFADFILGRGALPHAGSASL